MSATPQAPDVLVRVLGYDPNQIAALVVGGIFCIVTLIQLYHVVRGKDWKWALVLPIGSLGYAIGFFIRYYLTEYKRDSRSFFIAMQIFIVCSPVAFLAFNYILFGRLMDLCIGRQHSLIRPSWIMPIFVASDFLTFIIQGAGASLMVRPEKLELGRDVFLAGLVIQNFSYLFFIILLVLAHLSVRREGKMTGSEPWWKVLWLLHASSVPIMVRCIYRTLEIALGRDSLLHEHEVYFYLLDTLALFLGMGIYNIWWPGWYIQESQLDSQDIKMAIV